MARKPHQLTPKVRLTRRGGYSLSFDGACPRVVKFRGEYKCVPMARWPRRRPLSRLLKEK